MARPEKTVFISYRRKDISWALAVYHYLTKHDFDVFFDYKSIPSGDFEQIIVGNIKARAHFLVILTPTALDRTSDPGDWLRREIENAISERRNIIPLFFDGFNFGAPSVSKKLTGKLGRLKRYNGLEVPAGYFDEAMERLRGRYLNVTLDAVLHPVSEEVQKKVKEQQVAANQAILSKEELEEQTRKGREKQEKIEAEELARIVAEHKAKREREENQHRLAEEKAGKEERRQARRAALERIRKGVVETLSGMLATVKEFIQKINPKQYGVGGVVVLALLILIYGGNYITQNLPTSNAPDVTITPTTTFIVSPTVKPTNTVRVTPTIAPTETPLPTPTVGFGSMIPPKDGMVMVYVPASEFEMGEEGIAPVSTVYLDAYWIDQTEVTNAMYALCVDDGECSVPYYTSSETRDSYYGNSEYDNYPVYNVSHHDAYSYCDWADRRLPTNAEWEKAASWDDKSKQKYIYPWGDSIDCSLANYREEDDYCVGDTTAVGSYLRGQSPYGAFDMAGNVGEWTSELYFAPNATSYRIIRGGAWDDKASDVRSAYRCSDNAISYCYRPVGFRCVMDASE
jgi:formylglycine-generating enzyme required for sulfatase activity